MVERKSAHVTFVIGACCVGFALYSVIYNRYLLDRDQVNFAVSPVYVHRPPKNITEGEIIKVILVTSFRGGSSFLGEIFNQNNDVIYWFEPLNALYYQLKGVYNLRGEANCYTTNDTSGSYVEQPTSYIEQLMGQLKKVLNCDLKHVSASILTHYFISWGKRTNNLLFRRPCNSMQGDSTRNVRPPSSKCLTHAITGCLQFKYNVVKTVRVGLYMLKELLMSDPNIRVIHYVRDPRGTINSRHNLGDAKRNHTREIGLLCNTLRQDHSHLQTLSRIVPDQVLSVRYEDLALDPVKTSKQIYDFLGLDMELSVDKWLSKNTNTSKRGLFSTSRISQKAAGKWRKQLPESLKREVDHACTDVLSLYGYEF